ncbi:MAG: hypothetical protein K0R54_1835 [Clostridiaceae bacterium]|jgi:SAM-dependent methyltransferase|nr:hypothetical protein [Clostridiaceae bacterium]
MRYPKYTEYEKLYQRYFNRSSKVLVDLAKIQKGDSVLDLCGGNGRLTFEAHNQGGIVFYVDQEIEMTPIEELKKRHISFFNLSVEEFVNQFHNRMRFNAIFCQQAVTYWFLSTSIAKFSELLIPNGVFIFNTFSKKPTKEPIIKEYEIDGVKFIETSYLKEGDIVHHIQEREGYEKHETEFAWISEETFLEKLSPYFKVDIIKDNNTAIYVCRKNERFKNGSLGGISLTRSINQLIEEHSGEVPKLYEFVKQKKKEIKYWKNITIFLEETEFNEYVGLVKKYKPIKRCPKPCCYNRWRVL